ncbi:hypothetical protein AVDCRST_MAG94-6805 [uncultured Leptolyngbya sp.]|uniref:Uncharacterized protein n=1 Tax=uncultured Leptolyngbya sp. TaxID=332963 RepID=A0A6J4PJA3_9CYAN|nr:hypothetical protein AVDCRST_MAG94-6805 [uncultured Leptolyngbya sp.]
MLPQALIDCNYRHSTKWIQYKQISVTSDDVLYLTVQRQL